VDPFELVIEAPEDVFVSKLEKIQGLVKAGDEIATLESARMQWISIKLDSKEKELDIQERFFTERRCEAVTTILQEQVDSAQVAFAAAKDILDRGEMLMRNGAIDYDGLSPLRTKVADVQSKLDAAQKDQLMSSAKFDDLRSKLAIDKERLKAERDIYNATLTGLRVVSPTDGWFVASVGEGGFVMSGNEIGVVYAEEKQGHTPKLMIAAPDDVTVTNLHLLIGKVRPGDLVADLKSSRLQTFDVKLKAAREELKVKNRFFTDGRKDKLEAILKSEVSACKLRKDTADRVTDFTKMKLTQGVGPTWPEYVATIPDQVAAGTLLNSAQLELSQFPNKVKDMKDRIDNLSSRLDAEKDLLETLQTLLSVAVPPTPGYPQGRFVAKVGVGGFVQCGDPIGEIQL
jgi:hypothetical protein